MAAYIIWDAEQRAEWDAWVEKRPEVVKKMCISHPGDRLYKNTVTDQHVTLSAYYEDGTVRVVVDPAYNRHKLFVGHAVFGVPIENLVEIDLPDYAKVAQ